MGTSVGIKLDDGNMHVINMPSSGSDEDVSYSDKIILELHGKLEKLKNEKLKPGCVGGEGFVENIEVIDEWKCGSEEFRLINPGGGPDRLQVLRCGKWTDEKMYYQWGVITRRLKDILALTPNK